MITIQNGYAVHSMKLNLACSPYVVRQVTVPATIEMIRYTLITSPMEHDHIVKLREQLADIGIVLSLVDMVNHGIRNMDLMHSRAARLWESHTPYPIKRRFLIGVKRINKELVQGFGHLLPYPGIACIASEYADGDLLLEVRRVIRFDTLNHFESCL
ncbi:hypothetical protein D9M68_20110 [compost metagenome]